MCACMCVCVCVCVCSQNPFNVVRTVFHPFEGERELSLFEKSDLFFHDYSLSSLFVQENYARVHQPITHR